MPKLIIDHRTIEVPTGTKVIEAAERLGIMIPRFCYHVALGAVGACRLCAVKFLDGPVKGLQMSCMVDAQDAMVVSTTDAEAVDFRRQVIEWLMLHHPHDCPVCDEGGHCLLQDHTESSGHAIRRYRGHKRTHHDQYLGPLLQHEMNRCIQCYRCTRFYREFAGYGDLDVMQIGSKVYFGRHRAGVLQSPFAGNLADICPTGVFTDKPSRFVGRRWDYERTPSICINCSLGCSTVVSARYREVVRQEARFNAAVNGHFICDRGRHGFTYTSAAQRPRTFRLGSQTVDEATALQEVAQRLVLASREHGLKSVACIGSLRSNLETQGALVRLCQIKGWPAPAFFDDNARLHAMQSALAVQRPDLHVSLRDIEHADAVLLVSCDPLNEAPTLALALRQAQRRGAPIICADPRPVDLPLRFRHIPVSIGELSSWMTKLLQMIESEPPDPVASQSRGQDTDPLMDTARLLGRSRRPVIVCGTDVADAAVIALAGKLARTLHHAERRTGLFTVLAGPNAYSAALLSEPERSIAQVVAEIERGQIKALLVVETDPFWNYSNRQRLANALAQLDLLVVMDYLEGLHGRDADVFLPTTPIYECGGVFINQEGRAQAALPALAGGTPIRFTGGGSHPPRIYGAGLAGAEPIPAWYMLSVLTEDAGFAASADILPWLASRIPGFSALAAQTWPAEGLLLSSAEVAGALLAPQERARTTDPDPQQADSLVLFTAELTFGSEELSCRSPQLVELESSPRAVLSRMEAARLNLREGDRIAIDDGAGDIEIEVTVSGRMAPGDLLLPRHHRLNWQRLSGRRLSLPLDRIKKVNPR